MSMPVCFSFLIYDCILGQPLDTVKVKMQTFPSLYSNWIKCFNKTFQLDGIRGLYAGIFVVK